VSLTKSNVDPGVAQVLRDRLKYRVYKFREEDTTGWHTGSAGEDMRALADYYDKHIKNIKPEHISERPPGRMYEVNIKAAPEHFLDWDKPLSEQSEKVQKTIGGLFKGNDEINEVLPQATGESILRRLMPMSGYGRGVGDVAHDRIADNLRQAGIPGIKYLDQGSRAYFQVEPHEFLNGEQGFKVNGPKGDVTFDTKAEAQQFADGLNKGKSAPTYNYVVFDDKLIDIIKKYGIAGLIGAGASNWSPDKQ
jgi:hypothetical protein